ncbi:MAG: DUF1489 domain-containing protein [Acidisphaera sp.]|nr:DUF1489 domain-containing protein [Acidisphaera sp.]
MLHLAKLCVGVRDVRHLRALQKARREGDPPLRHRTRNFPRRADEILEGGSIYWVIAGAMVVRQRVVDIRPDARDDGTACAGLVLAPRLVPVAGRLVKPFQGWRYLLPEDAPPDLDSRSAAQGEAELPVSLRRALLDLGLL